MDLFREYVTSGAFKLSLSKVQIDCLCQVEQTGGSWMLVTTFNALAAKGLVERTKVEGADGGHLVSGVRITEAGRAVIPLLKLAGLYREAYRLEWKDVHEAHKRVFEPPIIQLRATEEAPVSESLYPLAGSIATGQWEAA